MRDKRKIFNNIVDVIRSQINYFFTIFSKEPNKILMSKDVFDFIIEHANYLGIYLDDECNTNSFMGMDVEVVLDKKGFVEVGCFAHNPITVNVSEGGGKNE